MVDAGGSRCKEASQSVSQLFQAAKPPPPYAPGRRAAGDGASPSEQRHPVGGRARPRARGSSTWQPAESGQ